MKKLLFTGGGGASSQALSILLSNTYDIHFGDADIDCKPFSISDDQWHHIPSAEDLDFVPAVVSLCKRLEIDYVIPTVDEELLYFARDIRNKGLDILLPPEDFVATHLDKFASNKFLCDRGLPAPKTKLCDNHQRVGFPCIVKPRSGRGSHNVAVIYSEQELQAHMLLSKIAAKDFIVQELMVGLEYTVMMAADRVGRLQAVVPVLVKLKRGITLRAITVRDENVITACAAIHALHPVPGCYNIQLIKTAEGTVMPFELNPRISTTTCLGLAAGVDFIGIFMGLIEPEENNGSGFIEFREGVGLRRSWYNEFLYT